MADGDMRIIHIDFTPEFKAGDPPPSGYVAWHEWATVQEKAGLRQRRCPICQRWRYPQEDCVSGKGCPSDQARRIAELEARA